MARRRLTLQEAMRVGESLPLSLWLDKWGRPLVTYSEWKQLPLKRRIGDVLLVRWPPKGFGEPGWGRRRR